MRKRQNFFNEDLTLLNRIAMLLFSALFRISFDLLLEL